MTNICAWSASLKKNLHSSEVDVALWINEEPNKEGILNYILNEDENEQADDETEETVYKTLSISEKSIFKFIKYILFCFVKQ